MAEYIERTEELVIACNAGARAIENTKRYHGTTYCLNVFAENPKEIPYLKAAQVLRSIDESAAADVVEVKHGRWVKKGQDIFCSECDSESKYTWTGASAFSNYCPNCGAKMDLEV